MKYLIIVFYSLIVIEKGNAHRQFNKISLCLSPTAKEKKSAHCPSGNTNFICEPPPCGGTAGN